MYGSLAWSQKRACIGVLIISTVEMLQMVKRRATHLIIVRDIIQRSRGWVVFQADAGRKIWTHVEDAKRQQLRSAMPAGVT
jgi:hypothetical protein